MKNIIVLLLFVFNISQAQSLFSEDFGDKTIDIPDLEAHWIITRGTTNYVDTLDNTVNNYDLSKLGSPLVGDSVISGAHAFEQGADAVFFVAANSQAYRILSASVTGLNMGSGQDFSVVVRFKTPAIFPSTQIPFSKRSATGYNMSVESNGTSIFTLYNGTVFRNHVKALTASNNTTIILTADRDGLGSSYVNTVTSPATLDISADAALTYGTAGNLVIGAFNAINLEYDGLIYEVAIIKRILTATEIKNLMGHLTKNWVSGGGGVTRSGLGWNQGILGDGLTVKLKGTSNSENVTITADSTRYTIRLSGVTELASDSVMFKTNTDSIWHSLPDSVFQAGYGLQIVVDAWEPSAVFIDNVSVTTYEIPVTTTGKFKGNTTWDKFKGW